VLSRFMALLPYPYGGPELRLFTCTLVILWWLWLLDIGSHIGYLQGLFCGYPESDKGQIAHKIYGGLTL
jgi:hypothetical protein